MYLFLIDVDCVATCKIEQALNIIVDWLFVHPLLLSMPNTIS